MSDNVFGRYLKSLRKSLHYTQEFVASELDISRQAYSHYETGRVIPPNDICIRLSEIYHIEAEKLLYLAFSASDIPVENISIHVENSEYLDFIEQDQDEKRTQYLSMKEKELLYYFGFLSNDDQNDILEFIKIKYKRKKGREKGEDKKI